MSLFKKLFAVASTVAMLATGLTPLAAQAAAHGAGSLVKPAGDPTVWFITKDGHRRAFSSGGALMTYGFLNFGQVVEANADDLALPTGDLIPPRDGSIFCATATKGTDVAGECALITGGMKARYTSAAVFAAQGHTFAQAEYGDSSFLSNTTNIDNGSAAHRAGELVNIDGTIYLVGSTSLLGIPSVAVFDSWGYCFCDAVPANTNDRAMTKSGVMVARVAGELNPSFTTPAPNPQGDGSLDGGETSIENFDLNDADDTTIMEDDNDAEVAEMEFSVEDADAKLVRADLIFDGSAATEDKPWNVFDSVAIKNGSTTLASMDTDNRDDWTETDTNDIYRVRFSNFTNNIFDQGDDVTLTVVVDVASSVDDAGVAADWDVYAASNLGDDDGLRFIDGAGLDTFDGEGTTPASFTIDEVGADDSLDVKSSTEDPDSMSIQTDETDTTEETIFAFKLETGDDSGDVQVNEFDVVVTATDPDNGEGEGADGLTVDENIIDTLFVDIDGTRYDAESVVDSGELDNSSDDATYHFEFDDGDVVIDGDDSQVVEVIAKFRKSEDNYDNGTLVEADVDGSSFDATSIDSDDDITVGGAATGEEHTLLSTGIGFEFVDGPASKTTEDAAPDTGTFVLKYEISAFGDDMTIDKDCDGDGTTPDTGVAFTVDNGSTVLDCTVSSTADDNPADSNAWLISEGDTETFTLTVAVEGADSFEKVWLDAINYDEDSSDTSPDQFFTAGLGEENTSTDELFLSAT